MPELLLLSLPTEQVEGLHRANADPATAEIWRGLWREHHPAAEQTVCFICSAETPVPPSSLIVPDWLYDASHKLIVPLCRDCAARPTLVKYNRALKLVRELYKARTGKRMNLRF